LGLIGGTVQGKTRVLELSIREDFKILTKTNLGHFDKIDGQTHLWTTTITS